MFWNSDRFTCISFCRSKWLWENQGSCWSKPNLLLVNLLQSFHSWWISSISSNSWLIYVAVHDIKKNGHMIFSEHFCYVYVWYAIFIGFSHVSSRFWTPATDRPARPAPRFFGSSLWPWPRPRGRRSCAFQWAHDMKILNIDYHYAYILYTYVYVYINIYIYTYICIHMYTHISSISSKKWPFCGKIMGFMDTRVTIFWSDWDWKSPSHHPFGCGIFPHKNHPAMGVPPWLWKAPYSYNIMQYPVWKKKLYWYIEPVLDIFLSCLCDHFIGYTVCWILNCTQTPLEIPDKLRLWWWKSSTQKDGSHEQGNHAPCAITECRQDMNLIHEWDIPITHRLSFSSCPQKTARWKLKYLYFVNNYQFLWRWFLMTDISMIYQFLFCGPPTTDHSCLKRWALGFVTFQFRVTILNWPMIFKGCLNHQPHGVARSHLKRQSQIYHVSQQDPHEMIDVSPPGNMFLLVESSYIPLYQ